MTKKIGVITINDFNNYGNRLQCYAVQQFLENMGYVVENIYNEYRCDGVVLYHVKNFFRMLKDFSRRKRIAIRNQNFHEFNKYIHFSEECIIDGRCDKDLNNKYDFFITGSDQVWNPYDNGRSETDFLTFANAKKRVSFAASIGVEVLPNNVVGKYTRYLQNYRSISVREETGKSIVEYLTNRKDIEVLVDPTMLLTAEEWEKVARKPNLFYKSKYILSYFLGNCKEKDAVIKDLAKKYCCEVIDIYDKNSIFYTCGPQHFLELEKNAFLICTDSFHSAVFAFLFNKPFIVFDRKNTKINMNTRIENFLSKFELQQNKFIGNKNVDEYLQWDYSEGYKILEQEREKATQFISRALE